LEDHRRAAASGITYQTTTLCWATRDAIKEGVRASLGDTRVRKLIIKSMAWKSFKASQTLSFVMNGGNRIRSETTQRGYANMVDNSRGVIEIIRSKLSEKPHLKERRPSQSTRTGLIVELGGTVWEILKKR